MRQYSVSVGGQKRVIGVEPQGEAGGMRVVVDGQERQLEPRQAAGLLSWLDGTRMVVAEVQPVSAAGGAGASAGPGELKLSVSTGGYTLVVEVADVVVETATALQAQGRVSTGPVPLRAPMPGRVVKVLARAGDEVKAGQGVMVVEAMKMENEIRVPRDGRLREIRVAEGAAVEAGEELAMLD